MHLKLRDQRLKSCIYVQTTISKPHGNHKPKIYIDTHIGSKKESKHSTKESHQIIREQKRKGRKISTKTNPKQLIKWQ